MLNSPAGFPEAYYISGSGRSETYGRAAAGQSDQKHFVPTYPAKFSLRGYGYPISGVVNQQWGEFTGRAAANWTPKLDYTDQTLVYGSFARGYKAGGANPPGRNPSFASRTDTGGSIHASTDICRPEFVNAYEGGTKNTLLDGALTLNGDRVPVPITNAIRFPRLWTRTSVPIVTVLHRQYCAARKSSRVTSRCPACASISRAVMEDAQAWPAVSQADQI